MLYYGWTGAAGAFAERATLIDVVMGVVVGRRYLLFRLQLISRQRKAVRAGY